MHVSAILAAFVAVAATVVSASPLDTVVERKPFVQYASHVKFAAPLERRNPPPTTSATPTPTTTSKPPSSTSVPPTSTSVRPSTVPSSTSASTSSKPTPTNYPGKLVYNGGPILANVEVTPLWWGSGVKSTDTLPGFYAAIVNSTHYDMLVQYSTKDQVLGRGSAKTPITLSGQPSKTSLDNDNDIVPYLKSLVQSGTLKPNGNSYYPIHFAPGIKISLQGQGSCSVFCAYHYTIDISSLNVGTPYLFYGVIPDQGGSCAGGCGSSSNAFNNLCSVASHELVEATTDPAIGVVTGNTVSAPAAWYDEKDGNSGGEIGDLCNGQQGTFVGADGKTYTLQKEYSNKAGGCVVA
ncbi:hypothetical protein HDU76_004744 [Blyttiomyces sp. JEL0837]|nr:hypothetical protein HDU76_004744 [Blyttiomyces sp. JEL0837]